MQDFYWRKFETSQKFNSASFIFQEQKCQPGKNHGQRRKNEGENDHQKPKKHGERNDRQNQKISQRWNDRKFLKIIKNDWQDKNLGAKSQKQNLTQKSQTMFFDGKFFN